MLMKPVVRVAAVCNFLVSVVQRLVGLPEGDRVQTQARPHSPLRPCCCVSPGDPDGSSRGHGASGEVMAAVDRRGPCVPGSCSWWPSGRGPVAVRLSSASGGQGSSLLPAW
nr:uncharacterized protein LOC113818795 [Penaeus vannamei]